jgi:hypothetical protein
MSEHLFRNFDREQMERESGGRQLDSQGRPLVGRYRDGSTPRPELRAFGAGQMQVRTAREAARRAGIPWNQDRFMRDREYNLSLADAHMGHLIERYGDRRIARAAYHSGEGTVDRAIARYGRDGFAQGLGPEGRRYINADAGGGSGGGGSVPSEIRVPDVRDVAPTPGEVTRNNTAREYAVANPFEVQARARTGAETVRQRQLTLDEALQAAIDENNREQESELNLLQQMNTERAAVRDEITRNTRDLIARTQPIFQQREAIGNRLNEIANMNPFQRMVRGAFDPNYNVDDLQARYNLHSAAIQDQMSEYEAISTLQTALISQITERHTADQNVFDMLRTHRAEDLTLLGQSASAGQAILSQVTEELRIDNTIEQARSFAVTDTVSSMSLGQLNDAASRIVDGRVTINGIEIPAIMIQDRLNAIQDQQYDLAARQLGIQSQNMNIADQAAARIIGRMTREEVDAAIRNGGVYNGQQFQVDQLLQQQAILREGRQAQAQDLLMQGAAQDTSNLVQGLNDYYQSSVTRGRALGGR